MKCSQRSGRLLRKNSRLSDRDSTRPLARVEQELQSIAASLRAEGERRKPSCLATRKRSPPELRRTRGSWRIKKSEWRGKIREEMASQPRPGLASSSNAIFLQLIKVAWSEISFKASDRLHDRRQFKSEIYQALFQLARSGQEEKIGKRLKASRGLYRRAVAKGLDESRLWDGQPQESRHRSIEPAATFDFAIHFLSLLLSVIDLLSSPSIATGALLNETRGRAKPKLSALARWSR